MNNISGRSNDSKLVDRIGQFVTVPFSFIHASKELSFHACWLFVVLRFYTNRRTGNAFPSYTTIRKITGMRREKISESLKELEQAGWLKKQSRFGKVNLYTVVIPQPFATEQEEERYEYADDYEIPF
jgi:hypothetical protein